MDDGQRGVNHSLTYVSPAPTLLPRPAPERVEHALGVVHHALGAQVVAPRRAGERSLTTLLAGVGRVKISREIIGLMCLIVTADNGL